MPFSAGDTLLHYRLIRKLGEGGMGEVYLADARRLKRQASSDGREILYIGGGVATGFGPIMRVPVRTTETFAHDRPDVLFDQLPGINFAWFSVAPDGQRFLAIEKQAGQTPKVTLTLIQNWARGLER